MRESRPVIRLAEIMNRNIITVSTT
ncbi:hypothetical protein EMIT0158MI4_370001 [Burkholderia ambifaria]